MNLQNIMLSEISQTETDEYCYHLYVNLKSRTNEYICKTETASQIQKTNIRLPKGRGEGRGANQGYGINIFKLLYINR